MNARAAAAVKRAVEPYHAALREARAAAEQSQQAHRFLAESMPQIVWTATPDGDKDYVNRVLDRYLGEEGAAALGSGWRNFMHPDDIAMTLERWEHARRTGETYEVENRLRCAGGVYRWFLVHAVCQRDDSGRILRWVGTCTDIDDRKRAEQEQSRLLAAEQAARKALQESEEHFRLVANTIPQLAWMATPDGDITWYNQRWYDYTGTAPEAQQGWEWQSVVDPADLPRVLCVWKAALAAGTPWEDQFRLRRASDGSFRWFLSRALPLRDGSGRVVRWFGTNVDIDDQKRAEAQMAALLGAAPVGVALLDTDLRYLRINDALAALNGIPAEEHIGKRFPELLPDVAARLEPVLKRVIASGEPVMNLELGGVITARPGAPLHTLTTYYPVRVEGQVTGVAAIVVEITDRKKIELRTELLAQVGAVLSSALDPTQILSPVPDLVVPGLADWCSISTLDDSGRAEITAVKHIDERKAERIREACGRDAFCLGAARALMKILRSGRSIYLPEMEAEGVPSDARDTAYLRRMQALGTTSLMCVPILVQRRLYGAIGCGMSTSKRCFDRRDLAVAEEVGRRVGMALDNARLFDLAKRERVRAEEAARAKDEFLAVVSHELRTPLSAVLGWARLLRGGTLDPAKQSRALETIERNARAQAQLIEDLLDISRIITGKLRLSVSPVDLPQLVASAIDTVRPAADAKGVQLTVDVEIQGAIVPGDPDRLGQVVWNIVSNAVKFTPRGGRVDVRLRRHEDTSEISVEDTGRGIPSSFLPHVFERFQQAEAGTTRSHGGLGLGLAIVRHLVELHGGTIRVHSEGEGRGAKFVVRLPAEPLALSSIPAPSTSSDLPLFSPHAFGAHPELAGLHVLVVEDEPDARDLLRLTLEQASVRVDTAKSAEEALGLVQELRPDVLLSDIGMPGLDGYAFIQRVRSLPPEAGGFTPAIAITAYARMEDRTQALLAGFTNHLPKPVEPAELLAILANVSGRLRAVRP
jgi:PAS domain S-box-containing protein